MEIEAAQLNRNLTRAEMEVVEVLDQGCDGRDKVHRRAILALAGGDLRDPE